MTGGGESRTISCGRKAEAVQLTEGLLDNREFWPLWLLTAWQKGTGEGAFQFDGNGKMRLVTRTQEPEVGDWIVREPSGDLMSVSAEEFDRDFIVDYLIDVEDDEPAPKTATAVELLSKSFVAPKKRKRRKK